VRIHASVLLSLSSSPRTARSPRVSPNRLALDSTATTMPAPVDLIANSWDQLPKPCVSELGLVHAKGCQFLLADEVRPPQIQAGDINIV
jgi:hypothetical protein